jgi:hypothetical protein
VIGTNRAEAKVPTTIERQTMNPQIIGGILRHVLTTAGGALVAKGLTDSAGVEAIVGGLLAIFGVIWSITHKKKAQ